MTLMNPDKKFCNMCGYTENPGHTCPPGSEVPMSKEEFNRCERCGRMLEFSPTTGVWYHLEENITDHEAKLDLAARENSNEFMPAALMAPVAEDNVRCPTCAERVTKLSTGGYVHNYAAIGEKLAYVKPSQVLESPDMVSRDCADLLVVADSGTYDNTSTPALMCVAINAAMVLYFKEELDRTPDWVEERDWASVRYYGERKRCGCPTCMYRSSDEA